MGNIKSREARPTSGNGLIRLLLVGFSVILEGIVLLSGVALFNEYAPWIAFGIRVLSLFLVLGIYGQNKTASIRMTWIIVILVAPLIGVTLYGLIGISGSTRKMRRRFEAVNEMLLPLLPENSEISDELEQRDRAAYNIASYVKEYAGFPLYRGTQVRYFSEASDALESMLASLAKAEHFIFMEYHAIEDAESFRRIESVLVDRVKHGVEVRLFYDDAGSILFINTDFVEKMEALGIKCRVFNPFSPGMRLFLHNRDHRKITVI
ncbi:MAG: cardiolipin synthase, partial [Bacillota bacterium]|nr:cardiolipin synthase [Bacillota bacterium]